MKTSQTKRITEHFQANPCKEIDAPTLNAIGANNPLGYCNAFSKKISDSRKHLQPLGDLLMTRDVMVDGQRQTAYTYFPKLTLL